MASAVYDPLDARAAALKFGILRVELTVSGGQVVKIEELEAPRARWTLDDLKPRESLIE